MKIKAGETVDAISNLCIHDQRHPEWKLLHGPMGYPSDAPPRGDCVCDNCFHGRDRLACEILALREAAKSGNTRYIYVDSSPSESYETACCDRCGKAETICRCYGNLFAG